MNPANQLSRVSEDVPVLPATTVPRGNRADAPRAVPRVVTECQHPVELVDGGGWRNRLELHFEALERPTLLVEHRSHGAKPRAKAAVGERRIDLHHLERCHLHSAEQQRGVRCGRRFEPQPLERVGDLAAGRRRARAEPLARFMDSASARAIGTRP